MSSYFHNKTKSPFRNKYTNANVLFDVIDHNIPPLYMVNSLELIVHDK